MSLLSVVKDVCTGVGVLQPTTVFGSISGNRTMQEMLALANEMAQRIAYDTREWTKLKAAAIHPGDGSTVDFNLNADFKRMLLTGNVWRSTSAFMPMRFVPDLDEWMQRRARGIYDGRGEWIMYGGQIHIQPPMGAGVTARYPYLSKNCVALYAGGFGSAFVNDADSFALDERLLKLGMIWQWKASKGGSYTEDMGTYGDALTTAMGSDEPSPIIVGRTPASVNAKVAYPWPVPT